MAIPSSRQYAEEKAGRPTEWNVPFYSPTFHTGARSSHYISKASLPDSSCSSRSSSLRPAFSLLQTNTFSRYKIPVVPKSAPATPTGTSTHFKSSYTTPNTNTGHQEEGKAKSSRAPLHAIRRFDFLGSSSITSNTESYPSIHSLHSVTTSLNCNRNSSSNNHRVFRTERGQQREQYPRSVPCTPIGKENIPRNVISKSPVLNPSATRSQTKIQYSSSRTQRIQSTFSVPTKSKSMTPSILRRDGRDSPKEMEMGELTPNDIDHKIHKETISMKQMKHVQEPMISCPPPLCCKNVVIFDWDDTLLPSYDLQRLGLRPKTHGKASNVPTVALTEEEGKRVVDGLKKLEQTVQQLLFTALQYVGLGHVIIVTNAERGWVELSCSTFLPNVLKVLRNCKVVSARSTFEPYYPQSAIEWKRRAIKMVLDNVLNTDIDITRVSTFKSSKSGDGRDGNRDNIDAMIDDDGIHGKNKKTKSNADSVTVDILQVVSIGDSLVERQAVFDVTKCINFKQNGVKSVKTKSVKLTTAPTIHWLLDELNTIQRTFVQILQHPQDLDYQVVLQQKTQNVSSGEERKDEE